MVTTKQTVATNEEAYASAEALYRHGKAIGLDVLQAQVDLTGSRFTYIKYAVAYRNRPGPDQTNHRLRNHRSLISQPRAGGRNREITWGKEI